MIDIKRFTERRFVEYCLLLCHKHNLETSECVIEDDSNFIIKDKNMVAYVKVAVDYDFNLTDDFLNNVDSNCILNNADFSILVTNNRFVDISPIKYVFEKPIYLVGYADLCKYSKDVGIDITDFYEERKKHRIDKERFDCHLRTFNDKWKIISLISFIFSFSILFGVGIIIFENEGLKEYECFIFALCLAFISIPLSSLIKSSEIPFNDGKGWSIFHIYDLLLLSFTKKDDDFFKNAVTGIFKQKVDFNDHYTNDELRDLIKSSTFDLEMHMDVYRENCKKISELSVLAGLLFTTSICLLVASSFNNYCCPIVVLVTIPALLSLLVGVCANIRPIPQYVDPLSKSEMISSTLLTQYMNLYNLVNQNNIQSKIKRKLKDLMRTLFVIAFISEMILIIVWLMGL